MKKMTRREFLGASLIGLGGIASYEWTSIDRIQYERHTLKLPMWKADGFKVAFLTDFHIKYQHETNRALKAIQMAVDEKPDMILFGGDFVDAKQTVPLKNIQKVADAFNSLSIPSYGVYGNHDHALPNKSEFFDCLDNSKLRILKNEIIEEQGVQIIGINDPLSGHDRYTFLIDENLSSSRISLVHEPDFIVRMPYKMSLQLSGHSHGGQICFPFGIPYKHRYGAQEYFIGFYPNAPSPVYVSRGVGTSKIDLRIFCPPEVSILTLVGA